MGSHPRLKPDFRPLRRGRGAVQLGTSAAGGIILAGLAPGEIALLDRLDGSHPEEDLFAVAASAGVERERATQLLNLLRTHRVLLTDRPPVREPGEGFTGGTTTGPADGAGRTGCARGTGGTGGARGAGAWVVVDGTGTFTVAVAGLLRAGDLGRVDAGPWAADVADAEVREAERSPGAARPALLVLVDHGALDPRAGEPWRRRGIPVLPVAVDGEQVVVGPLVGADPALPCLRCLWLRRTDRDAGWIAVLERSAPHRRGGERQSGVGVGAGDGVDDVDGGVGRAEPPEPRPDVASVAAGVVAMVVRAALNDDHVPPGVSVEVAAPWPRLDHRRWTRHPACPGHAPAPVSSAHEGPAEDPTRLG